MADIRYVISVDSKGAVTAVKDFDQALKDVQGTTDTKTGPALGNLWKQFAIGQIAADALKKGLGFLKDELFSCAGGAIEEERTQIALKTALETTGRTVDAMLPKMLDFSTNMAEVTTYTEEEITAAQTLLTQLTNLDRDGIAQATKGAMGLATVMDTDLQGATMMVTKAMEGNYQALQRVGIRVNENLPPHEKQAELMRQLLQLYPRATSELDTFGGKLKSLKSWWGELKDEVGKAITENATVRDLLDEVRGSIIELIKSGKIEEWAEGAGQALANLVEYIETNLPKAQKTIEFLTSGIKWAYEAVRDYGSTLKGEGIKSKDILEMLLETLEKQRRKYVELGKDTTELDIDIANLNIRLKGHDTILAELPKKIKPVINETGNLRNEFKETITVVETFMGTARPWAKAWKAAIEGEAVPAARNLVGIIELAPSKFRDWSAELDQMPPKVKDTFENTKNYFDDFRGALKTGWDSTIQDWLSGATTFEDFLKGMLGNIKDAAIKTFSDLASSWLTDFLSPVKDAAKGAAGAAGGAAGGGAGGLGGALGGIASSVGPMGVINTVANVVTAAASVAELFKGPEKQTDVTYWLKLIKDNTQNLENMALNDHKGMLHEIMLASWSTNDFLGIMYDQLVNIAGNTAPLKNIEFGQHGINTYVSRPTMFVAGERGPEHVMIQPQFSFGGIRNSISIDGRQVALAIAPYMPELTRMGIMKFHKNGLVEH